MSNSSLREQLAALSSKSSSAEPIKHPARQQPAATKSATKGAKSAAKLAATPAWLERARYGVALLRAHFPLCFDERDAVRPLKTGIHQDLVKQLGGRADIAIDDKACMVSSLAYYVNSVSYHKSVILGASRVDLDGQVVGSVTAEEASYSKQRLQLKWQKRQSASSGTPKTASALSSTPQEEPTTT